MSYQNLAEAFAARVAATPQTIACVAGGESATWSKLSELTARYMAKLRRASVVPGERVVLSMRRSISMVAATLAVHATGAVCVPVDPEDPTERREMLYRLAGMRVCLADQSGAGQEQGITLNLSAEDLSDPAQAFEAADIASDAPAFVFFTSGSTGVPKGVILSHAAVLAGQSWLTKTFDCGPSDTMLLRTAISTTNLVREIYWPVLCGARIAILAPGEHRDPVAHVRAVQTHGVTVMLAVPSLLRAMADVEAFAACDSLRKVFSSSDMMPGDLPQRLFSLLGDAEVYNLYGLTEALYAGLYRCQPGQTYSSTVPVGQDAELRMLILDDEGTAVAPGDTGHLCLGGVGIASGYLNDPVLSANRFIERPDPTLGVARMFRTGDLARREANGTVTLLGRSDDMVKIRGYRVETGEVASRLAEIAGIEEAAVVGMDDTAGTRRLVAFLVLTPEANLTATALRDRLAAALPDYMIPAAFVEVDAIPLSHNGKIDTKALREARVDYMELASEYVAPRTGSESYVAAIWADILNIPKENIGMHDDFFALGGDSIKGFLVAARLNRDGFALEATQVFSTPTVAEMALSAEAVGRVETADLIDERDATEPDLEGYGVFGWDRNAARTILQKIQ
jgi:amino acid adenylation domain-containing protein